MLEQSPARPLDALRSIKVTCKGAEVDFTCAASENILHAGLRAGAFLPYECATGTCGTCRATLIAGEIEEAWSAAPGWKSTRRALGEVLLCQSRPASACTFRLTRPFKRHSLAIPQRNTARVVRSGRLTDDVVVMQLRLDRPMDFAAGQFVLLSAPGVAGFRAYSMSNRPDGSPLIELIAKRKPDGVLSELLFSNTLHDVEFQTLGPLGRAVFDPDDPGDLIFVAGGTGVAGPMSILSSASASRYLEMHRAAVFFGVRRATDLFFLDRLSALKAQHAATVEVTIALSDEPVPAALLRAHPMFTFVNCFAHEAVLANPIGELTSASAYVAGPPPAVDAATKVVMTALKIAPGRIHFDRFG